MAKGINKVILIGNLGAAPEVRYMPSGSAVAMISVATTESWKDKQTNERQERTEWHRVVVFNKLAEITRDYLKKGSKVYVEGSLRTRKWQDKNTGQDKYTTEIVANDIQMLDSRNAGNHDSGFPNDFESFSQQLPESSGSEETYASSAPSSTAKDKDFDDDIPF